jgi:peptidoglycan/LPS O-acetylase OafA/YrhL
VVPEVAVGVAAVVGALPRVRASVDVMLASLVLPACMVALLLSVAAPGAGKGLLVKRLLGSEVMVWVGLLAWPIYLIHSVRARACCARSTSVCVDAVVVMPWCSSVGVSCVGQAVGDIYTYLLVQALSHGPRGAGDVEATLQEGRWLSKQHWSAQVLVLAVVVGLAYLLQTQVQARASAWAYRLMLGPKAAGERATGRCVRSFILQVLEMFVLYFCAEGDAENRSAEGVKGWWAGLRGRGQHMPVASEEEAVVVVEEGGNEEIEVDL